MSKFNFQHTLLYAAFFVLIGCYSDLPVDPVTGKPEIAPLQSQDVPLAAASAAIGEVRRFTETKLHIFIDQAPGCPSPTMLSDLQVRLYEAKSVAQTEPVVLQVDVPSAAFSLPLRIPAGQYRAELWNSRLVKKLASALVVIGDQNPHLSLIVPCRS